MGKSKARTTDGLSANEMKQLCVSKLDKVGALAWVNNTGAIKVAGRFIRFGKVGSSDVIGILPGGMFIGLEVKTRGDELSPEQEGFLFRVRELRGRAYVVETEEDIDAAIKDATRELELA